MQRPAVDRMLPAVFRRALPASGDSPLDAVLDTMVELHRHPEAVLAGLDDYLDPRRTPLEQAEQVYHRLLKMGREVDLVVFHGEPHAVVVAGKPWNRVEHMRYVLDWWDRHLKA